MAHMDISKTSIKGFTLFELIIVMIVIAILAVYVIFKWSTPVLNIDAEANQFANDIRYTRSLSITHGERYKIIRLSDSVYTITDSAGTPIIFPSGKNSVTLASGIVFGNWTNLPNNLITFDGKGTPYIDAITPGTSFNTATLYSITLIEGNTSRTVTISPTTGRVAVS